MDYVVSTSNDGTIVMFIEMSLAEVVPIEIFVNSELKHVSLAHQGPVSIHSL